MAPGVFLTQRRPSSSSQNNAAAKGNVHTFALEKVKICLVSNIIFEDSRIVSQSFFLVLWEKFASKSVRSVPLEPSFLVSLVREPPLRRDC